jgi:peptide/nickel transport system ATP-binding protein
MPGDAEPLLSVAGLKTWFFTGAGVVRAVDDISFSLRAGETLGIVGESGSGKSVAARSIVRLLDPPARLVAGRIRFRDRDLATLEESALRRIRGAEIAMVFQDPMTSLNPVLRIGRQVVEAMTAHGTLRARPAEARAVDLLRRMGVRSPERAPASWPHQFSGGMRQRVMLAMGFANRPALLIADEPTTALDVSVQAQLLDLLRELSRDVGTAVILISHDLGVIASICDRVLVIYAGEVVEEGTPASLLADPRHPYTWALMHAAPRLDRPPAGRFLTAIEGQPPDPHAWPEGCRFRARCPFAVARCAEHPALLPVAPGRLSRCWVTQRGEGLAPPPSPQAAVPRPAAPTPAAEPLLSLRGVTRNFVLPRTRLFGPRPVLRAVDGVDLDVWRGETVGLVGESGCGKSTLARLAMRLQAPDAGRIRFAGHDITRATPAGLRPLRRRMQIVFQDPYASLNPRMTVAQTLAGPLRLHRLATEEAAVRTRVADLLDLVGLPASARSRFPHEFSGGQRQRISIARALAAEPEFIIGDEPVSALDVNIQAQIINLLIGLQDRLHLTYLFIAHDLAVVRHISDRVAVMYLGRIVEEGPAAELFARPLHPYTRRLIAAAPVPPGAGGAARARLPGEAPSAVAPPAGCRFRTRCPCAAPRCAEEEPTLGPAGRPHRVACHFPG